MINRPNIVLLVGNIASGKSTEAKKLAAQGYVVVSSDAITMGLHAGDYSAYRTEHQDMYQEIHLATARAALRRGLSVVVDKLNATKESRQRWVDLARELDAEISAVILPQEAPEVHAQRRMESDPRGLAYEDWLRVAREVFAARYEQPEIIEGIMEVRSCV